MTFIARPAEEDLRIAEVKALLEPDCGRKFKDEELAAEREPCTGAEDLEDLAMPDPCSSSDTTMMPSSSSSEDSALLFPR